MELRSELPSVPGAATAAARAAAAGVDQAEVWGIRSRPR